MSGLFDVAPPTKHMKELCASLGKNYSIIALDGERVIYRDFGNGYDLEVSRINTSSLKKRVTIYLWKDRGRIIRIVENISQIL